MVVTCTQPDYYWSENPAGLRWRGRPYSLYIYLHAGQHIRLQPKIQSRESGKINISVHAYVCFAAFSARSDAYMCAYLCAWINRNNI